MSPSAGFILLYGYGQGSLPVRRPASNTRPSCPARPSHAPNFSLAAGQGTCPEQGECRPPRYSAALPAVMPRTIGSP